MEWKYASLLQSDIDENVMCKFPCDSKEEYTEQTGKEINDNDYSVIIMLNGLYGALSKLDNALYDVGYDDFL